MENYTYFYGYPCFTKVKNTIQGLIKSPLTLHYVVMFLEGEENFVGDSEIIALGGASNETKDRPLG